jgi:acyl carrier protein
MDDVVIASNGENLNPDIIEGHFLLEETEQICLVPYQNEIPTLVVSVDKNITSEKIDAIDSEIKEALGNNNLEGLINKIVYTVTPLMNENEFKVNRGIIRRKLDDGELQELDFDNIPQGEEPDNEVVDNLKRITAEVLGKSRDSIPSNADFFLELEGTSLDYFALVSRIEEEYGIKIELTEDNPLKSVNDFYRYIEDNA